ncbi:MAG: protein kinase [Polyangiaceae bacterium]|nr:protein kinase [Polyangiaceae bacterium]MBK8941056.1 protein kinase [Polyangiaceae bacterium]
MTRSEQAARRRGYAAEVSGVRDKRRDERVGRYALQGEVATGGMATVYYGRLQGPAGFSRPVAIKRLHPQYAKTPDFVTMFLDEARLASRIQHPNVVPTIDVVAEGGELFLVMEFVPGESLSKLVRACPEGLPLPIASALAVGMLDGLHAAHEAVGDEGEPLCIVHRDVSPQNVLVATDGVARLIDFGVAKAVGNATLTRDGQIKGKVAYMAPEQIKGEAVDRRADIYAASVVLWEMLTGRRFFGSADSEAALVLRALEAQVSPPSEERSHIPKEVDAIVLRGLERDRERRFATAREMAQALERAVPPAASRDVAAWLEKVLGESAEQREQRLHELDASVATELPGRASAAVLNRVLTAPALVAPTLEPAPDSRPRPPARTGLWVGIAVVLAGGLGFFGSRLVPAGEGSEHVSADAVGATGSATVPSPSGVASAAGPLSPASPSASAFPDSSAATGAPSASAPSASAPPVPTATARSIAAPRPPSARCSPPFVITADGVKQYKPECLR